MKILRLSLNNLASIAGTYDIHFEQAPLAHAGLIAITGKTGAGKSTLLDAMCLALYDRIPRLNGAAGSIKDITGQDLSIKDPKHILRRGCTSGFAELEFIALDGQRYQARWEVWRAHKKVDGNLKYSRAITCLEDQRVLNHKVSEATPIIEKLVGLSFEQFTRAVLLAQSEVGAFLKAKDHERADLLEYLTNSKIFSEVSKKSAQKYSQVKQQRSELENIIGHIELLSDDEADQLTQQQQQLSLKLHSLQQSEKLLDVEKQWHIDRHELYASTQAKKEIYDVQLDADLKLQPQKQLLAQLDRFQVIRAQYQFKEKVQLQLQGLEQEQQDFQPQLQHAQMQSEQATQALYQAEQNLAIWQQQFEQLKPQLEQAYQLDHEIQSKRKQHQHLKQQYQHFSTEQLQPLKDQSDKQQRVLAQALHQKQQLQQQLKQPQTCAIFDENLVTTIQRLDDYVKQYQQLHSAQPELWQQSILALQQQQTELQQHLTAWHQQHQSLALFEKKFQHTQQCLQQQEQQLHGLERLQQYATQMWQYLEQRQQLEQQLATEQEHLHHSKQQIAVQQKQVQNSETALQHLEEMLAQQRLLQHHSVQALREQLKPDVACMVCGSHQHPFIEHENLLQHALADLQDQQLQRAKHAHEQHKQQLKTLEIQASTTEANIQQQQQQIERLSKQMVTQQQQLEIMLDTLQIELDTTPSAALITTLQNAFNQATDSTQQLKGQLQHDQQLIQTWRITEQKIQQLQFSLQQRQQLQQVIEPILQQLSSEQLHLWQANSLQSAHELLQQLQQRQQQFTTLEQQQQYCEQLENQLQQQQLKLELLEQQSQQQLEQLALITQAGKQLRNQLNSLTQAYAGLAYQHAHEWQTQLAQEQQMLQQLLNQQRQQVKLAEDALQQLQLKQQHLTSQMSLNSQQLAQATQQIAAWQTSYPDFTSSSIAACLAIEHTQQQQLRQTLLNHQHALDTAKTSWQTLEEQYAKHLRQQPEHDFDSLETQLATLKLQKTTLQEAFNEIDARLRIHSNNQAIYSKYQTQIEQIKAEEYRWGRIYDLIGHREGTKFQKIAQEHHLDILVEYANQQLQPLSPRYQLHRIPDSLSLAIIDLDMNSEIRPVLSLSGGETFLVSLALALAIANMAAGSMKLESLFIDEGFGTLDPASLHMVMNALDHLQSQGRKVVLISHVQEMHERIPVQIQVKPIGSGASQIKIVS